VLVVDDHPVVVDGVRQALRAHPSFDIVGQAGDRDSALRLVTELQPDIVLLDLCLDGLLGPDLCRAMVRSAPRARVLLHTAFHEYEPLQSCLDAGAVGVVFKDGRDLVRALHTVAAGKVFLQSLTGTRREATGSQAQQMLSPREYDVLCALAFGRSTDEISQDLHLTVNTVRSYVKTLLTKLHANSRVEALARARSQHLL
jgi:two-component system nitrate/nitrite response regulator NarL